MHSVLHLDQLGMLMASVHSHDFGVGTDLVLFVRLKKRKKDFLQEVVVLIQS